MPYTNEVDPVYVQGGDPLPLTARLWEVVSKVGPAPERIQTVNEEQPVPGVGRRPFTLQTGPTLPGVRCGLTLHDSAPGIDGPLYRFGDTDILPAPFPADPEGYVSYVALGPVDIDASTVAARDWPFTALPLSDADDTVTGLAVAGGANTIDFTVTGTGSAGPFTCAQGIRLRPSWRLDLPAPVEWDPAGSLNVTGTVSADIRRFVTVTLPNAYVASVISKLTVDAILAHAAVTFPPPKPFLIPGALPPGVVLSVRRIRVSGSTIATLPAIAGWGNVTVKLFPLESREPVPQPGKCAVRRLARATGTVVDLALFRHVRDRHVPAPVVDGYYRHGAEVVAILHRHPALARRAGALLLRTQRAFAKGRPGLLPIPEGAALLRTLARHASASLRPELLGLASRLPVLAGAATNGSGRCGVCGLASRGPGVR